jgi:hypothetical protein
MKKRKFAGGGMSDYAQAIAEGRDAVADPEDPSGSYARSMLGGTSKPKQRIVSKKELEDSGLSLRDFLNKERGLTRRKSEKDPTAGEAKDKAAQRAADMMGEESSAKSPEARGDADARLALLQARVASIIAANKQKMMEIENAGETRRVNRVKNALGMMPDSNEAMKEDMRIGRVRNALGMSAPSRISSGTVGVVPFKRGGKAYASGGSVGMASKRADGIAQKGKTKGKIC